MLSGLYYLRPRFLSGLHDGLTWLTKENEHDLSQLIPNTLIRAGEGQATGCPTAIGAAFRTQTYEILKWQK